MFVRIIRGNNERESVYECSRVHIINLSEDKIAFEMENDTWIKQLGDSIRVDIDKTSGTEVYFMNEDGKTIDVYRWSKQKVGVPNV